jgi:DNA-directed RNA polymerase subunit M/transcription elongation factor TFIIS
MIHLVRCLCPARHCLYALAYDAEVLTDREAIGQARAQWRAATESGQLDPWCGLCGSREIGYESGATRFRTLAEALPELRRIEAENLRTRAALSARVACPACGGLLVAVRAKLVCAGCGRVVEGCCEGARG